MCSTVLFMPIPGGAWGKHVLFLLATFAEATVFSDGQPPASQPGADAQVALETLEICFPIASLHLIQVVCSSLDHSCSVE